MTISLTASTGEKILVWREETLFHARRESSSDSEQVCLPVDLFEVIADLAGLDIEVDDHAKEAIGLAAEAHRRIGAQDGD